MDINEYSSKDRAYIMAHDAADRMLAMGEIKAYSATHDRQRGRLIYVETDQGWNPDPFFEEWPLESWER